jgi:hypothetical protein
MYSVLHISIHSCDFEREQYLTNCFHIEIETSAIKLNSLIEINARFYAMRMQHGRRTCPHRRLRDGGPMPANASSNTSVPWKSPRGLSAFNKVGNTWGSASSRRIGNAARRRCRCLQHDGNLLSA